MLSPLKEAVPVQKLICPEAPDPVIVPDPSVSAEHSQREEDEFHLRSWPPEHPLTRLRLPLNNSNPEFDEVVEVVPEVVPFKS